MNAAKQLSARERLALSGDRSGKHMPADERDLRNRGVIRRLFDSRGASSADDADRLRKLAADTEASAKNRDATRAAEQTAREYASARAAKIEEIRGPQLKQRDIVKAFDRLAEATDKQTAVLDALVKALTSGSGRGSK